MSKKPWGYQPAERDEPTWELHPQTHAVRAGLARSGFGETSEALYLNSGFTYTSAQEALDSFADETDHFLYSRFHNPTVAMFEQRLAAIEGAEYCVATGSGMSAMFASIACLVSAGDRVVASASMFSSCHVVLTEILPKWGITTELVKGNDAAAWAAALSKPTKAVFIETPSNPMMDIVDIAMVSELAHKVGATVIVDNVMASPILQKPLQHGADVVMYSATKHIDGQGRVLAGAVLGSFEYIHEKLIPFNRHTGPALSPFTAWVLVKSLETLDLRVERMTTNAQAIAEFSELILLGEPKPIEVLQAIIIGFCIFCACFKAFLISAKLCPSTSKTCQLQASKRNFIFSEVVKLVLPSIEIELLSHSTIKFDKPRCPAIEIASCEIPSIKQPSPAMQ